MHMHMYMYMRRSPPSRQQQLQEECMHTHARTYRQQQLQEAMRDYQMGTFGVPWDHALPDEQWAQHTAGARSQ